MTVQECYAMVGGDYEDVLKRLTSDSLVAMFLKKFPTDNSYRELVDAMEAHETEAAFHAAHTLKGVTANLGLTKLNVSSTEVCELLRAGDYDSAAPLMPGLCQDYDLTLNGIQEFIASEG